MAEVKEFTMKLAAREWARLVYSSVVKSLPKTITEPATNSDTSYKRLYSVPDASGLVERALAFEKGAKFDLSSEKKRFRDKHPERLIEIHLYTAQGHGQKKRICDIVDFAEGLSPDDLKLVFRELAADKTGVSKGRPGRSLFGRGVSDVLLGHQPSTFYSYKDNVLSKAEFSFDHKKDGEPRVRIASEKNPNATELKDIHLRRGLNGSCVRCSLHDDCRIPDEGTFLPILSQFYMLRLINSDPNVRINVIRYRSGKNRYENTLEYDFPIGDVIGKFSFQFPTSAIDASLKPVVVDAIVCRVEGTVGLPGRDAGDQRANGLLFVDDKDAVFDLTFLPQYEGAPYLSHVFGIVRLKNVRDVFSFFLNDGKDSPLTVTRDGFDLKHEFTKALFKELTKHLEPIYKKEEERFNKSHRSELSDKTRERMSEALKELNKFLRELGEGERGEPPVSPTPKPDQVIQFMPQSTKLVAGRERPIKLYVQKSKVKANSTIIYDSSNSRIEVSPMSHQVKDGLKVDDYLMFALSVKSDVLHEIGKIAALAEGTDGVLEAYLEVQDVVAATVLTPPEDMEFRPRESRGLPSRENGIVLFINPSVIPIGRKIKLEIVKAHGGIVLFDRGQQKGSESISVTFEKSDLIPNYNIGRILIPWRGTGWGQSARVAAETKKPDGSLVRVEGRMVIEQPEDSEGIVKRVEYMPLENQTRSHLVDGVIYINSNHYLNKTVFGNPNEYSKRLESDHTAQYKFSELIVEQCVYRLAEDTYTKGRLSLQGAPVSSIREFVDKKTHELAPKIARVFITV